MLKEVGKMGSLFNQYDVLSYSKQEVTIADRFPAIYISDNDEVFCYTGILFKNEQREPNIRNSSFRVQGKHSTDKTIVNSIKGFYRIINGCIVIDDYIDKQFGEHKYKHINGAVVRFPVSAETDYGVAHVGDFTEDKELTRKIFGLTCSELRKLLVVYANIFGIYNNYTQYPRLTRSTRSYNFCDMTGLFIPKQFPYIAFDESSYEYSHVSLWGFYNHLGVLLHGREHSIIYREFIKAGIHKETLDILFQVNNYLLFDHPKVDSAIFEDM